MTGCVTAVVLASFSWPLGFATLPLIWAAGFQEYLRRAGRILVYVLTSLLSLIVVPVGIVAWVETIQGAQPKYDLMGMTIFVAWMISPVLLLWCDAELLLRGDPAAPC